MKSNNSDQRNPLENSLKLLIRSSSAVLIGLIISKIMTYVYRIIIARRYGPEVYGIYSLALMLTGWVALFSILGLDKGIIRYISIFSNREDVKKARCIFKYSLYTVLFLSLIICIILLFSSTFIAEFFFKEPKLVNFLIFFSLAIPFTTITSILLSNLRSHKEISWNSFVSNIFSTTIKVVLILILLIVGFNEGSIIFSYLFGAILTFILAYIVGKRNTPEVFGKNELNKSESRKLFKEVISYSWPFLFVSITWRVFFWTDSFIIGMFKNVESVGIYNSAVPLAITLTMATEIFMQYLFPFITKEYYHGKKDLVSDVSKQVGKWILAINLPILAILIVFSKEIIVILFGKEYIGASASLIILSIGMLFFSIGDISNRLLAMAGKSKLIFTNLLLMVFLNILLNVILIPKFDYTGAALATMFSMMVFTFVFGFQSKSIIKIIPLKYKMINVVLSSAIPALFLFLIKSYFKNGLLSLIIASIIYVFIYLFLLIFLKAFDDNDKFIIKSLKNKIFNTLKKSNK